MTTTPPPPQLTLGDLQLLAQGASADLAEALVRFVNQPDPPVAGPVPKGALDATALQQKLNSAYHTSNVEQRRVNIALAWQAYLTQQNPPPSPRFLLADFLVSLYERGDDASRSSLLEIIATVPLKLGVWGGLKRIYKLAEARHDALIFGALAARLDVAASTATTGQDVSKGTFIYLKRRVWRYLRQLATALPELYPQFAAATLVNYPEKADLARSWVAAHIFAHESGKFDAWHYQGYGKLTEVVKDRAFDELWKLSADPLMVLLDGCSNDLVARFAIGSLKRDFPDVLRNVAASWLDRLTRRPLESLHEFVVDTLSASPEFHAGKLKALGLHDTVLSLLVSPSSKARTYAIEYARAHAQDLGAERLVEFATTRFNDTNEWALSVLKRMPAKQLGYALFGRLLLGQAGVASWAAASLNEQFDRSELPRSWLIDLLLGEPAHVQWAQGYLSSKYRPEELGADFWKSVLADRRARERAAATLRPIFAELLKFSPSAIGGAWALDTLTYEPWRTQVEGWLKQVDDLPGVDLERVKGLVFDARLRPTALALLGRPRIARFSDLTLGWLLALARRADPTLNQWATRYLLQNVSPADAGGSDRLFELATGPKEPEAVRLFAQTYLLVHHPTVGPEQPQTASYQLKAQLTLAAYKPEPFFKALFDARPDVRKFAVTVTRASLRPWQALNRVYELADSEHKEVRTLAFDALLKAGQPGADPVCTLTVEEISPERVFAMTESRIRASRELAMELLARHYDTLGGPERLGWLMASSDRTVRQMAVRLLWERHRPKQLPPGWKPRTHEDSFIAEGQRFGDVEALRGFLRVLLFGLPPGRAAEPAENTEGIRRLSAGEAKQRAIEAAQALALDDAAFARVVAPLLSEFTGSVARGEWETCLSALASLQAAHPTVDFGVGLGR